MFGWYNIPIEINEQEIAGLKKEDLIGSWGLPRRIIRGLVSVLKYRLDNQDLKVEYELTATIDFFGNIITFDYPELIRISGENWMGRLCENYYEIWLPKKFHLWLEELRAAGPDGLKPIKTKLWYKLSPKTHPATQLNFSR